MNSPVEQIKERLSIEEVVSSYIKLEPAGANLKAKCPFHSEKTPSFFVSPARGLYNCFGCGSKGDIFGFVQEFEGLDFRGALKLLADRAGVSLARPDPAQENEKTRLYEIMEKAALFFQNNLAHNIDALTYLAERGLHKDTIESFRLGFAPDAWTSLREHLADAGCKDEDLERAGLIKRGNRGYYDRFRSRIVFPLCDSSGRVIAFSGRIFGKDADNKEVAKYLNSPETPLFNKSAVLYGIDRAKDSIRRNNFSILVEGQMDLVLSHQAGFRNAVATSGTALSEQLPEETGIPSNLVLVSRLSGNIVLAFDEDSAGFKAALRAGRIALGLGMDVKVADMPAGYDPADLIAREGSEAWKKAIRGSRHLIDFILNKILTESKDARAMGKRVKEELLPHIAAIPSAIERSNFIRSASDATGIPETALADDLTKVINSAPEEKSVIAEQKDAEKKFRRHYIERKIWGIIFWQEAVAEPLMDVQSARERLREVLGSGFDSGLAAALEEKDDMLFEAEIFYQDGTNLKRDFEELLSNLAEEDLREALSEKMRELKIAERSQDSPRVEKLLRECQIISQKIEEIKRGRFKH